MTRERLDAWLAEARLQGGTPDCIVLHPKQHAGVIDEFAADHGLTVHVRAWANPDGLYLLDSRQMEPAIR